MSLSQMCLALVFQSLDFPLVASSPFWSALNLESLWRTVVCILWDFNPHDFLSADQFFLSSSLSRGCRLPPSQCNIRQSLFLPSTSYLCLQRSTFPWYCIMCIWLFPLGEHILWFYYFFVCHWLTLGGCPGLTMREYVRMSNFWTLQPISAKQWFPFCHLSVPCWLLLWSGTLFRVYQLRRNWMPSELEIRNGEIQELCMRVRERSQRWCWDGNHYHPMLLM